MTTSEAILTYVGFNDERTFGDYVRHIHRFWECASSVIHHVVLTNQRVILVQVSNPFDSFLFGPLLLDGIFYFPRLRWFKDRVLEGRLDKALETNLKKWIHPISEVSRLDYDGTVFAIHLKKGRNQTFRLKTLGAPMTPLGGDFPHKEDFRAATEAFNRLASG
ncbi:MAG TPA: hypothetical protein VMO47_05110 [Rhodothermales bacterium]|nr:hypothetical protein [Rhodothermales bacterium]